MGDGALIDLAGVAGAMVRDPHRLPGAHPCEVLGSPVQLLERSGFEDRQHRALRVLGVGAVGDPSRGELRPRLGPDGDRLGQAERGQHLGGGGEGTQHAQVVAVDQLHPGGEAHHLEVSAQARAGACVEHQQQGLVLDHHGGGHVLDPALR